MAYYSWAPEDREVNEVAAPEATGTVGTPRDVNFVDGEQEKVYSNTEGYEGTLVTSENYYELTDSNVARVPYRPMSSSSSNESAAAVQPLSNFNVYDNYSNFNDTDVAVGQRQDGHQAPYRTQQQHNERRLRHDQNRQSANFLGITGYDSGFEQLFWVKSREISGIFTIGFKGYAKGAPSAARTSSGTVLFKDGNPMTVHQDFSDIMNLERLPIYLMPNYFPLITHSLQTIEIMFGLNRDVLVTKVKDFLESMEVRGTAEYQAAKKIKHDLCKLLRNRPMDEDSLTGPQLLPVPTGFCKSPWRFDAVLRKLMDVYEYGPYGIIVAAAFMCMDRTHLRIIDKHGQGHDQLYVYIVRKQRY